MTLILSIIIAIIIVCYDLKKEKQNKNVCSIVSPNYTSYITNGGLPVIDYNHLNYLPGEKCHLIEAANYFVTTKNKKYYRTYSGETTYKKNKRYRTSDTTSYSVTDTSTTVYKGRIIITNKRIIFSSNDEFFCISLSNIVTYVPYSNAITLNLKKGHKSFYVPNGYVIATLIYNILNENKRFNLKK